MGSTRTSILEILRNANSSVSILRSCGSARYLAAQRRTIVKPSQIGTPAHASRGIRRRDGPEQPNPYRKPLLSFGVDGGRYRYGEASFSTDGTIKSDYPVPTTFASKIVSNAESSDVTMVLEEGNVKELAVTLPPSSDL